MGKPIGYHPARLQRACFVALLPAGFFVRSGSARERFDGRKPPALHVPQALPHSAFRIPHSAFRIPHSACLFYTQKIRNRAAHTLFDSFATAPFLHRQSQLNRNHNIAVRIAMASPTLIYFAVLILFSMICASSFPSSAAFRYHLTASP